MAPPASTPRSEANKLRGAGNKSAQSDTETAGIYTADVSISQIIDNERPFSVRNFRLLANRGGIRRTTIHNIRPARFVGREIGAWFRRGPRFHSVYGRSLPRIYDRATIISNEERSATLRNPA